MQQPDEPEFEHVKEANGQQDFDRSCFPHHGVLEIFKKNSLRLPLIAFFTRTLRWH
jgi:hypothetical protein